MLKLAISVVLTSASVISPCIALCCLHSAYHRFSYHFIVFVFFCVTLDYIFFLTCVDIEGLQLISLGVRNSFFYVIMLGHFLCCVRIINGNISKLHLLYYNLVL